MSAGDLSASLDVLRQFVRPRKPGKRCELCGLEVAAHHAHLLDRKTRILMCACGACTVLFSGHESGKYKRVPDRILQLPEFRIEDAQWESLMIPINMAFLLQTGSDGSTTAVYPSPAGPIEAMLDPDAWGELLEANPVLRSMESEVEALLVNRLGPSRGFPEFEYYLLPIDECYALAGLVRAHWHGLSGGTEMWAELQKFFDGLKTRSEGGGAGCPI